MNWSDRTVERIVTKLHPEQPECPLCGSHNTRREERDGQYVGWRLWECRGCGAGFRED